MKKEIKNLPALATFKNRNTEIPSGIPVPLSDEFAALKQANWKRFMKGVSAQDTEVRNFDEIIAAFRKFLLPPIHAAARRDQFLLGWKAGKAWEQKTGSFLAT